MPAAAAKGEPAVNLNKLNEEVLAEIEAFMTASGTSATRFGKDAAADPNLVFDLRKGARDLKATMIIRLRAFIRGARRRRPGRAHG